MYFYLPHYLEVVAAVRSIIRNNPLIASVGKLMNR